MALSASILVDGKDIRATYGLEILSHDAWGSPELKGETFRAGGFDGEIPGPHTFEGRRVAFSGRIDGSSHSDLFTKLDALKAALSSGHLGTGAVMVAFTDLSDRYYRARCLSLKATPIGPMRLAESAQVEITLAFDDPLAEGTTFALANHAACPFSSPFSTGINYQGTGLSRPRIVVENIGANNITSLTIINTAIKNRLRSITPGACANLTRVAGRWGDVKGAANFVNASTPSLRYASQGNFNAGSFSIFMFIQWVAGGVAAFQYYFSTTGNIIKLYHDNAENKLVFDMNGDEVVIADSVSGFTAGKWYALAASYNGLYARLSLYDIAEADLYSDETVAAVYYGLPTNFYIGTDATPANSNNKYVDEVRLYNRQLTGIGAESMAGTELEELCLATRPLPLRRGCTFYLPFDSQGLAYGLGNTSLVITQAVAQNSMLDIDCETQDVNIRTASFASALTSAMASVTGEFPFLLPGINGLQVIYTGSVSALNLAIEDKRRYL